MLGWVPTLLPACLCSNVCLPGARVVFLSGRASTCCGLCLPLVCLFQALCSVVQLYADALRFSYNILPHAPVASTLCHDLCFAPNWTAATPGSSPRLCRHRHETEGIACAVELLFISGCLSVRQWWLFRIRTAICKGTLYYTYSQNMYKLTSKQDYVYAVHATNASREKEPDAQSELYAIKSIMQKKSMVPKKLHITSNAGLFVEFCVSCNTRNTDSKAILPNASLASTRCKGYFARTELYFLASRTASRTAESQR